MPWKMFLIEPTPLCRLSLRRFAFGGKRTVGNTVIGFKDVDIQCPKGKDYGHDASVVIAEQIEEPGGRHLGRTGFENDPRWPVKCASCDYLFDNDERFGMGDPWQVNYETLYKGALDGKLYVLRENPPGATWTCDWFPDEGPNGHWSGPDGKVWAVMLPGGLEWIIYSHSVQDANGKRVEGPKWNVQGTPPVITVQPSIDAKGRYHGHIADGIIGEDCEGRTYPGLPRTA